MKIDETVDIWGIRFKSWTLQQTLEEAESLIRAGKPSYFLTVNLHTAMLTSKLPKLAQVAEDAAFNVADGMPLVWAARLRGHRLPERVTGADLLPALCQRAAQCGFGVYFLGGPPGVAEAARDALTAKFPGLRVVGLESPPYRPLTAVEENELRERILAAKPEILFVASSQPKGEYWVHDNYQKLGVPLVVQIGAAIDFAAGRISRAPRWVQKTGLEWGYRLAMEPRRLLGRYASNARYLASMVWNDLTNRKIAKNRCQAKG